MNIFLEVQGGSGFDGIQFLLLGGIFIVMYFFLIRPQSKKAKEQAKFQDELKNGEKVVTTGGIHGKIVKSDEKTLQIEVDNNVRLKINKAFISMELTREANAGNNSENK